MACVLAREQETNVFRDLSTPCSQNISAILVMGSRCMVTYQDGLVVEYFSSTVPSQQTPLLTPGISTLGGKSSPMKSFAGFPTVGTYSSASSAKKQPRTKVRWTLSGMLSWFLLFLAISVGALVLKMSMDQVSSLNVPPILEKTNPFGDYPELNRQWPSVLPPWVPEPNGFLVEMYE